MEDIAFNCKAWIWNGKHQMAGTLQIKNKTLLFLPNSFADGNLRLKIKLHDIVDVSTFLLFDLTKNGIKLTSNSGTIDHFIIEAAEHLCKMMELITLAQQPKSAHT